MDDVMNDRIDYDYHIEEDSDLEVDANELSSDEEFNRGLEDSFEQIENEVNMVREDIKKQSSSSSIPTMKDDFLEIDDKLYEGSDYGKLKDACGSQENKNKEKKETTDDDLLYDPSVDEENEKWVENERKRYRAEKGKPTATKDQNNKNNSKMKYKSDAILSCPACMTTVCIDCQRHDLYKTQYRAMFAMNCAVTKDEVLRYETKQKGRKKNNADGPGKLIAASETDKQSELYNPVKCTECGTVVAVYDIDEIFHFFNILASQA